jgi:uncharacterized protein (TIGR00730 family)
MSSICVYCGSSEGNSKEIINAARELGERIAQHGCELVYGGGSTGLMGVVARATLMAGGAVVGIIPTFLHNKELTLDECTELIEVPSMHSRKALMIDRSDVLVALPGGLGTMDELFEALTWLQLNLHAKPVYVVNIGGYFDELLALITKMHVMEFISSDTFGLLTAVESVRDIPLSRTMV